MDLHEEMDQLRALRDEVRLQLELGRAEARERFAPLEERFGRLEAKLRELRETGREELEDVRAAARLLIDEIREGYEHLRARL